MNSEQTHKTNIEEPTEESARLKEERLRYAHATAVDKIVLIIDQPMGMLSFMAKLAAYGISSAICTVALSSLMESRRLRKEAIEGYKSSKMGPPNQQTTGMGTPHGHTPRANPFPLKNMNSPRGDRKAA